MRVFSKAAVVEAQIKNRKLKGSNMCEIHLVKATNNLEPKLIYEEFQKQGMKPMVVHAPIKIDGEDFGMGQPNGSARVDMVKSIEIAAYISKQLNEKLM